MLAEIRWSWTGDVSSHRPYKGRRSWGKKKALGGKGGKALNRERWQKIFGEDKGEDLKGKRTQGGKGKDLWEGRRTEGKRPVDRRRA